MVIPTQSHHRENVMEAMIRLDRSNQRIIEQMKAINEDMRQLRGPKIYQQNTKVKTKTHRPKENKSHKKQADKEKVPPPFDVHRLYDWSRVRKSF